METPPRYNYVLGVDPGTTTGLALARFDMEELGRPVAVWAEQLEWHEAATAVEIQLDKLRRTQDSGRLRDVAAVVELYMINAQTAQRGQEGANDALGMMGVVRRNCRLCGIEFAPPQQASPVKTLIQDHVLKGTKVYAPGLGHVNDAYRHALFLAVRRKWLSNKLLTLGLK